MNDEMNSEKNDENPSSTALVSADNTNHADSDGDESGKRLTIIEHLEELRDRIIVCLIALSVTTVLSFVFAKGLFALLKAPAGDIKFQAIDVTETISAYFMVAFFAGVILAIPVLIYEIVGYIAPALTPKERKYFFLFLPGALIFFMVGVVFGYYVILPPALSFLLTFGADIAVPELRIGSYVSTVTRLLFYIGLMFETPLIIFFLCKLRILSPKKLSGYRKYAIVGAFVISALITPTPDPVNQALVAIPLLALYEVGSLMARFTT